ncbi:MAG TPA: hypothetical protein VG167_15835 [Verrucomicrobiae bacterium]|nr:hypothetical protein [Verrucomicrobiae bacterium]
MVDPIEAGCLVAVGLCLLNQWTVKRQLERGRHIVCGVGPHPQIDFYTTAETYVEARTVTNGVELTVVVETNRFK